MGKVLITDIDSTMSDHWKRIRRNTHPWPGGVVNSIAFTKDEVLKDSLLPDCLFVLYKLINDGWRVRYLSARSWPDAASITKLQLTKWGVPNPDDFILCNNMQSKIDVLKRDLGFCDYYVDDFMTGQEKAIGTFHKDVAETIQVIGIRVLVFRNNWLDIWEQIRLLEEVKE